MPILIKTPIPVLNNVLNQHVYIQCTVKYDSFSFLDCHKIQALTFSLTRVWDHWCIQHCSNHPKNKLAAVINCCRGHAGKLLTKCKLAKCHVTEKKILMSKLFEV